MTLKTATVADLISWDPCYSDEEIYALAGDKTTFNALDVLQLDISSVHKFWVVLRSELLDYRTRCLFACNCVEHVLPFYENDHPHDDRLRTAVMVARDYANDNVTGDRAAAHAAVLNVERDTAQAPGYFAVKAAAWVVAGDTTAKDVAAIASFAAGSAAHAIGNAWATGEDGEGDWQIESLIKLIHEENPEPTDA